MPREDPEILATDRKVIRNVPANTKNKLLPLIKRPPSEGTTKG
jgi:hypothetical protein